MTVEQSESVNSRKTRWHQSTLSNLIDGCSWQYFLTYVLELDQGDKPYATVGTAYHSAVELHERNRMINVETSEQEMIDVATKYITETIKDEEVQEELFTNVKAAINNWYLLHRGWLLEYTPIAIEPEFTLPLVDNARPIGGYIDAVYRDNNTNVIFVVDHKTAKNFDRWRDGEGHRTQAAMYATALVLSPDFPEITELPEMVYMVSRTSKSTRKNFEGSRIVRVQPTIEDVKLLGDRIRIAEDIVKNETYKIKTDWPLCSAKWCPFFQGCQVDGTLLGTPDVVRLHVRQQSEKATTEEVSGTQGYGSTQYNMSPTTNNAEEV